MPSLTWYHGEKVLVESARIKMVMQQDKKTYYLCCLEISNVEVGMHIVCESRQRVNSLISGAAHRAEQTVD